MYRIGLCLFTSLYCEVFNDSICGLKAIKLQLRDNKPSARVNKLRAHRVWHAELTLDFEQRRCWEGDDFCNTVVCQKVPYLSLKIPHHFCFPKGPHNKDFCWDKVEILQISSYPLSNWMYSYIMKTSWGFQEIVLLVMKRPRTLNIDLECQNMCWSVYIYSQNWYTRRNYKILVMKKNVL